MSRDILTGFDAAGLHIASQVREIVGSDLFKERSASTTPRPDVDEDG